MKRRVALLSLCVLPSIVSCQGTYDDEPPPAPPRAQATPGDGQFVADLEDRPLPSQYQVRLRWTFDGGTATSVIFRAKGEDRLEQLVNIAPSARQYVDTTVVAGNTYRYVLGRNEGASFVAWKEGTASVPVDMEVRGTQQITGNVSVGRLFLRRGARLVSNGVPVWLEARKIHSEGGVIESFSEAQAAADRAPGRNGGEMQIRVGSGSGVLHVLMRGERGGKGQPGAVGNPGSMGGRGNDGLCGYLGEDDVPNSCDTVSHEQLALLRRLAERHELHRHLLNRFYCRVVTGNGQQGGQGGHGEKGGTGAPGGNSGFLLVHVDNPAGFEVRHLLIPGPGGVGGDGGAGGPGGPGGNPGSPDRLGICPSRSQGVPGIQGPTGLPGDAGTPGRSEYFCLRLGGGTLGECERFR